MAVTERRTGMEVYIGGRAQGKLEYVRAKYPEKERIVSGGGAGIEACLEADVIDHFHLFIRRFGVTGKLPGRLWSRFWRKIRV